MELYKQWLAAGNSNRLGWLKLRSGVILHSSGDSHSALLYLCKYRISGLLAVELFQDEVQEVYMFPSAPKKTNNICVVGRLIWKDAANYADSRPSCKYRWHQQRRNLRESRKPKKVRFWPVRKVRKILSAIFCPYRSHQLSETCGDFPSLLRGVPLPE